MATKFFFPVIVILISELIKSELVILIAIFDENYETGYSLGFRTFWHNFLLLANCFFDLH